MKKNGMLAALSFILAVGMPVNCLAQEVQTEQAAEENTENKEGGIASADEMAPAQELDTEGLKEVTGAQLKDGTYAIDVESSSSMFKIVECALTVQNGEMNAVMTMSGQGYLKLFMGTGEEALSASEEDFIPFQENDEGAHTFEVPVKALNVPLDCAAYSKKKEKWYERTLVFKASSLPTDAYQESPMTTPEDLALEDGSYTVGVVLEGGSGKTSVESPAALEIKDGKAVAVIVMSSSNYDYMLVNEEKYLAADTEGNSTFEIPVEGFDWKMPVVADTVAMGTPHEIDYTLDFDSETIKKAE